MIFGNRSQSILPFAKNCTDYNALRQKTTDRAIEILKLRQKSAGLSAGRAIYVHLNSWINSCKGISMVIHVEKEVYSFRPNVFASLPVESDGNKLSIIEIDLPDNFKNLLKLANEEIHAEKAATIKMCVFD